MADSSGNPLFLSTKRYAVVTGANRGIGLEICRQLASKGVTVVLTSRDATKGTQALEILKKQHTFLSDFIYFHQLDLVDSSSISSFSQFLKSNFGKLDILVNNAGILGSHFISSDAFISSINEPSKTVSDNLELTQECLQTNYYGAKKLTQALLPLLQLSDAGRVVNVTSVIGLIKDIPNESVRKMLSDLENLTEAKIDNIVKEFVDDMKNGEVAAKGWPTYFAPYAVSKAAMNAYTRVMAASYADVDFNCVFPGYVETDINFNTGVLTVEEGADSIVRIALLQKGEASGIFFHQKEVASF